jgi:hypothetical protein
MFSNGDGNSILITVSEHMIATSKTRETDLDVSPAGMEYP